MQAINSWHLPYMQQLTRRDLTQVDLVVIHCTELPDLATAREFGERALYTGGTGNSGHYYIDRDGQVYVFVEPDYMAHHTRGYNERSIGIELINRGRYPNWFDSRHQAMQEAYTTAQMDSLIALLQHVSTQLPNLSLIGGHEDLDTDWVESSNDASIKVRRKRDPGPHFAWDSLLPQIALTRYP